jgi:hypothetical protein
MDQNYWVIKTTEGGRGFKDHWNDFRRESVIAIGFSRIQEDPSKFVSSKAFIESVARKYKKNYRYDASTLYRFVNGLHKGEWVVITTGYSPNQKTDVHLYGFARIGKYYFDSESTWWSRKRKAKIIPIEKDIPISVIKKVFGGSLMQTLHGPYTRGQILDLIAEIRKHIELPKEVEQVLKGRRKHLPKSTDSERIIQYWWVNATDQSEQPWHWRNFFEKPRPKQGYEYGGTNWIKSPTSLGRIKNMRKGDIVIAYQAGEGIIGLAFLASNGYQTKRGGNYDNFRISSAPTVWLDHPISYSQIKKLPNAGDNIEFAGGVKQGTVFAVNQTGFGQIIELMLETNPRQRKEISAFFITHKPFRKIPPPTIEELGRLTTTHRAYYSGKGVVRDSKVVRSMKVYYQSACQVCGRIIELPNHKRYAEVHHLRPLGKPHNGKDGDPNIIVVCPLHHAMLDLCVMAINPKALSIECWDRRLAEHGMKIQINHQLDQKSLEYHYRQFRKRVK